MIRLLLIGLLIGMLFMLLRGLVRLPPRQRMAVVGKLIFWLGIGLLIGLIIIGKLPWPVLAALLLLPLFKLLLRRKPQPRLRPNPRTLAPQHGINEAEALAILELPADASVADIKAAHRRQMSRHHPDRGGTVEQAKRINQAKDLLLAKRQRL